MLIRGCGLLSTKYVVYRKRKIYVGEGKIGDLKMFSKNLKMKIIYFLPLTFSKVKSRFSKFVKLSWQRAILYKTVVSDLSDLRDVYYDILVFLVPQELNLYLKISRF